MRKIKMETRLSFESLEDRCLPAVTAAFLDGSGSLWIESDNNASDVRVMPQGTDVVVIDAANGFTAAFFGRQVRTIVYAGGSGDDRFINLVNGRRTEAWGGKGDDYLLGANGNDLLVGGDGNDTLQGGAGKDELWGQAGDNTLLGGAGNDKLYGGDGKDTLQADAGNDELCGEGGDDVLLGGAGNDKLYGGDGRDFLDGGAGVDTFWGGNGFDSYRDNFNLNAWTRDGFSRFDVSQGDVGTCWINAAMAEAADAKVLAKSIVRSGTNFRIRLFEHGQVHYEWVKFDGSWTDTECRPSQVRDSHGRLTGTNNGEFWTTLFQRAYLQYCGVEPSYQSSWQWYYAQQWPKESVLSTFSGRGLVSHKISTNEPVSTANEVRQAVLRGELIYASDGEHTYAVVNVLRTSNGTWKVKLYNPWGLDGTAKSMTYETGGRDDGEIILDWTNFTAGFVQVQFTQRQ